MPLDTAARERARLKAENFLRNETQYQLGFLPIEQANPKTATMDQAFLRSTREGVRMLQSVDRDLVSLSEKALSTDRFARMTEAMHRSLSGKGKVVFSGCGATGRLSILLEAAYRDWCRRRMLPDRSDSVFSIMTGGDYALIRSVEFFEDVLELGRQQVRELEMGKGDTLVAITGTGETTSILGTVMEAAERGADVFLVICVPQEIPRSRLERCRQAFDHPQVTVLDMPCGAMALSGSTRMQSTTLEMVVAGAALETAMQRMVGEEPGGQYAARFGRLLDALERPAGVDAIASYIEFEEGLYGRKGLVTYFADDFLLDILSDTTERSPTFLIPPFRKRDDTVSPQSWAFVKNPGVPTPEAWFRCFSRRPRCLNWTREDYDRMGASALVASGIPRINEEELLKFRIGNEADPSRTETKENAAVWISHGKPPASFTEAAGRFQSRRSLVVGPGDGAGDFHVPYGDEETPLRLFGHLSVKLVLNTVSTGTMVRMGRVTGNWMTWLDVSNKKLIDRSIRIVSDQCRMPYREACIELFLSIEELNATPKGEARSSPVQYTIQRLGRR
jgi:N-acetylmuramic acid 6-phosphate etherase